MVRFLLVSLALTIAASHAVAQDGKKDDAKVAVAKAQLRVLTVAVQAYAIKNNAVFPPTLQELLVKSETGGPYLQNASALLDPWKQPYQYDPAGPRHKGLTPDIWTVSPAKETIGNWPAGADVKKAEGKEPKKAEPEPKKDPQKKPLAGFPDVDEFMKKLPANLPKEQADRIRASLEQAQKRFEDAQKRADDIKRRPVPDFPGRLGSRRENRLGVRLEKPGDTLVAQLGLAEGKGLVIAEVRDGSAAAKAGLKVNDILLELAGKAVPSDADAFGKVLSDLKTGEAVDAIVLRKGTRETIKGVTLPETPGTPLQRRIELNKKRADR